MQSLRHRLFGYNLGMEEECPLIREFRMNPMKAMEFADNHRALPIWVRAFYAILKRVRK